MNWDWLTDTTKSLPIPLPGEIDLDKLKEELRKLPSAIARERIMSFCKNFGIDEFMNNNEGIGYCFNVAIIMTMDLVESIKDDPIR